MSVATSPPHGPPGPNRFEKRKKIFPVIAFLLGLVIGYCAHILQVNLQAEPNSRALSTAEPAR